MKAQSPLKVGILTLFTSLSAITQAEPQRGGEQQKTILSEFCAQAQAHGPRSWQALAAYDANTRAHAGVNLYMMNEGQRKTALKKMVIGLSEEMKNRVIQPQIERFRTFESMSDAEKTAHLFKEINGHGISTVQAITDLQSCSR